jgi:hypothetical protein
LPGTCTRSSSTFGPTGERSGNALRSTSGWVETPSDRARLSWSTRSQRRQVALKPGECLRGADDLRHAHAPSHVTLPDSPRRPLDRCVTSTSEDAKRRPRAGSDADQLWVASLASAGRTGPAQRVRPSVSGHACIGQSGLGTLACAAWNLNTPICTGIVDPATHNRRRPGAMYG